MFVPVKSNTGAMLPWEYLGAAADTYQAGQMLTVTGGKLTKLSAASTTTPPSIKRVWVDTFRANRISWVTTSMVRPSAASC